jgi:transcription elongation GreA/GreB family factor
LGALVELEQSGERLYYFIGPKAGGTEIIHDKKEVLVLTPQSPLGTQLCGRKSGDHFVFQLGGPAKQFRVVAVT